MHAIQAVMIFEHTVSASMIWIGLALAILACAFSFWRWNKKNLPQFLIAGVRLLFFFTLLWCLFLPGDRSTDVIELKPRFVVALDASKSMTLSASEEISNRWSVAMDVLDQEWADSIAEYCDIDAYSFSSEAGPKLPLKDMKEMQANGPSTMLRQSLQKITGRYAGLNVGGALLLTDANDTLEAYDDWASETQPFPIYTVMLEPDTGWDPEPDVRVDTVNTPRRVTVDWKTELKTVVSGEGTKGQAINVQLYKNDVLLDEQPTQFPERGGSKEMMFELENPEIGVFTYRVFLPHLAGETHTNDNEYAVTVQVLDAKNRLLYVEGPPRWESKFLSRALKANRQMTPLIFIRGPEGKFITFGARGSMTPEMKESQLIFFKMVVVGNLDAEELGEHRAKSLAKFVEAGGSLVLLGGDKGWGEGGFGSTSLKKLMPMKSWTKKQIEGEFQVALTDTGRSHDAFAGDPELWDLIPPVLSVFPKATPSAGARVLVAAKTPSGPQPLILVHRYGQGKVVAIMTDSLWKWRLSPEATENKPYQRFWDQIISWLSPKEKDLDSKELDIFADREQLYLGEEVEVSARRAKMGKDGKPPPDVPISAQLIGPDKRKVPFTMNKQQVETSSGKSFSGYAFKYKADKPGLHTVVAIAQIDGRRVESDQVSFFVKPFSPEAVPRPCKIEILQALAAASGGKFFKNIEDLNSELMSLTFSTIEEESAEYESLWQRWPIIALLMIILSAGWCLRKWQNMP